MKKRMCPRCGVVPLEFRKKYCHDCKKGFEYHGYTPKVQPCVKCDKPRLPGQGEKFCTDHKLTRKGDSQSSMAQRAFRYNIPVEALEQMEIERGGRCDICGNANPDGRALAVDHDHACCPGNTSCGNCIRGLLCSTCNRALGLMKDNPNYLRSAADYLEQY